MLSGITRAQDIITDSSSLERQSGGYYVNLPIDSGHTQKPTVALFKSMLVPGWGQLGNNKFIKAAIFMGLEGTFAATLVHYANKTSDARENFQSATDPDIKSKYFNNFLKAKSERNRFTWYLGTTIFISMFDAYVDAHLAKFPKYEKRISFDVAPQTNGGLSATLSLNF